MTRRAVSVGPRRDVPKEELLIFDPKGRPMDNAKDVQEKLEQAITDWLNSHRVATCQECEDIIFAAITPPILAMLAEADRKAKVEILSDIRREFVGTRMGSVSFEAYLQYALRDRS
jgi:hypothetical protein